MKLRRLFITGILILAVSYQKAQTNTFETVLAQLVTDCPEIQILKLTNNATLETERALNRLNSPEVSMEHVWGRNGVGDKFDLGINQNFDWPGLYRARAQAINAQTDAFMLQEQAGTIEKLQKVRAIMVDIIFQKKNMALDSMIHDHMVKLESDALESYNKGEISKLSYKRTQLERIQTSIQLRETERILNELYSDLSVATGRSDSKALMSMVTDVPQWEILDEEEYEEKLNTLDPRMAYLKATIEAVNSTSKAETMAARMPSFNIGYVFQREQGETFNGFNVALTLPIYGSNHVKNASKANILSAQLEAQSEQIALLSNLRTQRSAALSLAKELNDYAVIFEKGNYSELLKLALEGGETDNFHYLQELNYYIDVTRQYIELQHQYNLALVSLNRFDGL